MFICAYFPFSRFGIRLCSFVPIFNFLGLELGCVNFVLNLFSRVGISLFVCDYFPFSRFGIRLRLFCAYFLFSRFGIRLFVTIFCFLGFELDCVCLRLLSIFSVWN